LIGHRSRHHDRWNCDLSRRAAAQVTIGPIMGPVVTRGGDLIMRSSLGRAVRDSGFVAHGLRLPLGGSFAPTV
jgi:hypothetical protein